MHSIVKKFNSPLKENFINYLKIIVPFGYEIIFNFRTHSKNISNSYWATGTFDTFKVCNIKTEGIHMEGRLHIDQFVLIVKKEVIRMRYDEFTYDKDFLLSKIKKIK